MRLSENAHLLRYPHPSSLRRTSIYASFLLISEALHMDIFHQPLRNRFFNSLNVAYHPMHDPKSELLRTTKRCAPCTPSRLTLRKREKKMKRTIYKSGLFVVLIVLLLFAFGCSRKEEKISQHQQRARQYIENNELKKAVIELKNVVQLDPSNHEAYYELAETYLKLNQIPDAFQSLSRTVSIKPDQLDAQLKMGQIYLLSKQPDEARKKAELVLEKSPDHIEALILLSGVQVQEKDADAALSTLKKAISIDPDNFKAQLALAQLFVLRRDLENAEKAYLKTVSLDPSSRIALVGLVQLYRQNGQMDKAESELKEMVRTSGNNYQNLLLLASFYEGTKNWEKAEATLLEAVDAGNNEDEATPLMILGQYYARRGVYDKALETMSKAAAVKKNNLDVLVSIARLHFDFKKMKEAEAAVDKVLERDKGHVTANYLKGRLYLGKNNFSNALERFELVVRERPQSGSAHYFKALCLIGKGERQLAQNDLVKAVELEPRLIDARIILADFYLRDRNPDLAREQIEIALKQSPNHVGVLMLQGNLNLIEQDTEGAEAVFKKVIELKPDHTPAYVRLGVLYNLTNRNDDALKMFSKALELNPRQPDALALMVSMQVRDKKFDQALQTCENQKQKIGDDPPFLAYIDFLEGNIYQAGDDSKMAQMQFEKAIETDPNILSAYEALARIYTKEARLDEAISQYERILEKQHNYLIAHMALGTIYDLKGDKEKAETCYRKALDIKKDFAPAANNLAWNLADKGGNIDEALTFARIAKEQMPKNAAVMDTLGWIYYLKGSYLNAVDELQDSVEGSPENPVIHYHLGLAYYKNNEPEKAKEVLEKALELDNDFAGAPEAQTLLKEIAVNTGG
jgi:tetratricopeptide (TPR) repeat protein